MADTQTYLSERGWPLLYVRKPVDVPVVTLENYTKWYEIYLVNPDGGVEKLKSGIILEVCDKWPDARWVDHLYHPRLLYRVAEYLGASVCERAVEVAAGRWIMESPEFENESNRFKFYDPILV